MNTQTTKIAITFPKTLHRRAKQLAAQEYGLPFPDLVRHLLIDYVEKRMEYPVEILDEKTEKSLGRALEDVKAGKVFIPKNDKELRTFLGL